MAVGDLCTNEGDLEFRGTLLPLNGVYRRLAWHLMEGAPINPNDVTLPDGAQAGYDGVGGVLLSAIYDVTPGVDQIANLEALRALMMPVQLEEGLAFKTGGLVRVRFGRARGAFPDMTKFAFPTELRFMATDGTTYGPELGPFTVTHGTPLDIDAGGTAPTRQWSIVIAGPCVNPRIGYTTRLRPTDIADTELIIGYPTVASGHTLTVSGRTAAGTARATVDDGAGTVSSVVGVELFTGLAHQLLPVTQHARHFSFDRDSGANTATVYLRDGIA